MSLILASASPRRRELLQAARIAFEVLATDIPEVPDAGEKAEAFAKRMALEKAKTIAHWRIEDWVLGADTIVVADGEILGKPRDAQDAARMLRKLSGRSHDVITAVCLCKLNGGIMRCDVIAEGVVAAVKDVGLRVPLVVRLEGTNVAQGKEIIAKSNLNVTSADDLDDAAQKIVKAVNGG